MKRALSETGIYLVMTVAFIVVLLLLAAWVIGIGIMTTNEARLQRIGNLVALAALEDFAQRPPATPYIDRANSALVRSNEVLDDNRLPFIQSFDDIGHAGNSSPGGDLTFGRWFKADDGTNPCGTYPCFVANPPPGPGLTNPVDAVRIDLRTGSGGNPLEYIFCGLFGTCNSDQGIDATAFSSIVQRCTVFVSDISASTFYSTHKRNLAAAALGKGVPEDGWNLTPECAGQNPLEAWDDHAVCAVRNPKTSPPTPNEKVDISLPFLRYSEDGDLVIGNNGNFACQNLNAYFTPPGSLERFYWCNMNRNPRNEPGRPYERPDPPAAVDPTIHFRNDYIKRQILDVNGDPFWLWVDSFVDDSVPSQYEGPQPFTSFLKAFNAGLRSLNQVKTATDQAALMALNGTIKGRYPVPTPPALPQLSSNFGIMTQITNAENRGTVTWDHDLNGVADAYTDEIRPNFLDYGFYSLFFAANNPTVPDLNTNLILGLNDAINTLSANCPVSAQRMIVVATDGVTSCRVRPGRPLNTLDYTDYDCNSGNFQYYLDSEAQLASLSNTESVLSRLIQSQIGVIALVAGDHISPNFNNYHHNGKPVDISEMYARGLGGGYNGGGGGFNVDPICPSPPCDELNVFNNLGKENYAMPRPLAVLGDLAVMSGGLMCPLMPLCGAGLSCAASGCDNAGSCPTCCYETDPGNPSGPCKLKPIYRPSGSTQSCSVYQLSLGEQAAKCVVDGLGASPYILVAPEQVPPA